MSNREADGAGHYERKQLLSKDRLIAWSHRRRFETGLRLAGAFAGGRVLDYGCGDGTFLAMLAGEGGVRAEAVSGLSCTGIWWKIAAGDTARAMGCASC